MQVLNIITKRQPSTDKSTISEAFIDGIRECYFLEDVVREQYLDGKWTWKPDYKIRGQTAIPSGTYPIIIDWSNRFKRDTPRLLHVPDFSMIRIHPGNTEADTEGCLLPGVDHGKDYMIRSRVAYNALFSKIKQALDYGREVSITINNWNV